MNIADYVVIAVVVLSAIVGAIRGFLREAIALGTWIVALFVAWHFSDMIEPHLGGLLAGSYVRPWAARVIIVALIVLFGAALGAITRTTCGFRSSAAWTAFSDFSSVRRGGWC